MNINLIKTQARDIPQLAGIADVFTKAMYGSLITFLILGFLVGGLYVYLLSQAGARQDAQNAVTQSVSEDITKEGLLLAVRERAAVMQKLFASQKNVSLLFPILSSFVPVNELSSVNLDETNTATITVHVAGIADAITLVNGLLNAVSTGQASKPALGRFSLAKDNGYDITLSFVPNL